MRELLNLIALADFMIINQSVDYSQKSQVSGKMLKIFLEINN